MNIQQGDYIELAGLTDQQVEAVIMKMKEAGGRFNDERTDRHKYLLIDYDNDIWFSHNSPSAFNNPNPVRQLTIEQVLGVQDEPIKPSALDNQVGGDHYKKLGEYQPWCVLHKWLTPEELKGFMKGTVVSYLQREADKGQREGIEKAHHTLSIYLELTKNESTN